MTKLIIQHLWSDFKKHWLGILVTLVLCYIATIFVFTFGFWFFMVDSEAYLLSEAELRKMILNGSETYTLLYFIGTAGILLSVILISRKFPVRLLKPIYFCPADMRLKRKSLQEVECMNIILEGVLAIQAGNNPKSIERKLVGMLEPNQRIRFEENK